MKLAVIKRKVPVGIMTSLLFERLIVQPEEHSEGKLININEESDSV